MSLYCYSPEDNYEIINTPEPQEIVLCIKLILSFVIWMISRVIVSDKLLLPFFLQVSLHSMAVHDIGS